MKQLNRIQTLEDNRVNDEAFVSTSYASKRSFTADNLKNNRWRGCGDQVLNDDISYLPRCNSETKKQIIALKRYKNSFPEDFFEKSQQQNSFPNISDEDQIDLNAQSENKNMIDMKNQYLKPIQQINRLQRTSSRCQSDQKHRKSQSKKQVNIQNTHQLDNVKINQNFYPTEDTIRQNTLQMDIYETPNQNKKHLKNYKNTTRVQSQDSRLNLAQHHQGYLNNQNPCHDNSEYSVKMMKSQIKQKKREAGLNCNQLRQNQKKQNKDTQTYYLNDNLSRIHFERQNSETSTSLTTCIDDTSTSRECENKEKHFKRETPKFINQITDQQLLNQNQFSLAQKAKQLKWNNIINEANSSSNILQRKTIINEAKSLGNILQRQTIINEAKSLSNIMQRKSDECKYLNTNSEEDVVSVTNINSDLPNEFQVTFTDNFQFNGENNSSLRTRQEKQVITEQTTNKLAHLKHIKRSITNLDKVEAFQECPSPTYYCDKDETQNNQQLSVNSLKQNFDLKTKENQAENIMSLSFNNISNGNPKTLDFSKNIYQVSQSLKVDNFNEGQFEINKDLLCQQINQFEDDHILKDVSKDIYQNRILMSIQKLENQQSSKIQRIRENQSIIIKKEFIGLNESNEIHFGQDKPKLRYGLMSSESKQRRANSSKPKSYHYKGVFNLTKKNEGNQLSDAFTLARKDLKQQQSQSLHSLNNKRFPSFNASQNAIQTLIPSQNDVCVYPSQQKPILASILRGITPSKDVSNLPSNDYSIPLSNFHANSLHRFQRESFISNMQNSQNQSASIISPCNENCDSIQVSSEFKYKKNSQNKLPGLKPYQEGQQQQYFHITSPTHSKLIPKDYQNKFILQDNQSMQVNQKVLNTQNSINKTTLKYPQKYSFCENKQDPSNVSLMNTSLNPSNMNFSFCKQDETQPQEKAQQQLASKMDEPKWNFSINAFNKVNLENNHHRNNSLISSSKLSSNFLKKLKANDLPSSSHKNN